MRYSTYNAIPQYPKSKKHPYETLENVSFVVTRLDQERGVAVGIITRITRQNI